MNPMLMQMRIELSNAKREYASNELKLKRLFFEMQTLANPYYTSIDSIKTEEMKQTATDMSNVKDVLLSLNSKIKDLTTQLGEE